MRPIRHAILLAAVCAMLTACTYKGGPLVTHPDGTVDSTHGPNGAQTTPH
jgi:hypothetical protein